MTADARSGAATDEAERAAAGLLAALDAEGYDFVTVTPETHGRVIARANKAQAADLRDIFGWSLKFARQTLPPRLFDLLETAGLVEPEGDHFRSLVRASRIRGRLFLHSAFPTHDDDAVFLGPDSVRFADFLADELLHMPDARRLIDIGAGAGVGGIVASDMIPAATIELLDLNPKALRLARANAAHAGKRLTTRFCDGLGDTAAGFDIAVTNPPFMADDGGPAYRNGGAMLGTELSLRWTLAAAAKLAPGGRVLLYTGSPIVGGRDGLRDALGPALAKEGCSLRWREIDPDIFGEELDKPGYGEVERIAAIGAVVTRAG